MGNKLTLHYVYESGRVTLQVLSTFVLLSIKQIHKAQGRHW